MFIHLCPIAFVGFGVFLQQVAFFIKQWISERKGNQAYSETKIS
jgi:hypothetical protein